jgi:hypothetical protein
MGWQQAAFVNKKIKPFLPLFNKITPTGIDQPLRGQEGMAFF